MRAGDGDRVGQKLRCLAAVGRAGLDEAREFLLVDAVETYLKLNEEERSRYAEALASAAPEVRAMQTWAEKLETRYRALGREAGRAEGARTALVRLLERRFGAVPKPALQRLDGLDDPAELERLFDRALDAGSLGELGLAGP